VNRPLMSSRGELQAIARRTMIRRGLLPDFSPAVLTETDAVGRAAAETDPSIRDLRGLLWCSIDNDDSRDLDQLSVADPTAGGTVKIRIAVADVDALVREGSAIDGHARTNTTSVYTAAKVFPMLPEKLSARGSASSGRRRREKSCGTSRVLMSAIGYAWSSSTPTSSAASSTSPGYPAEPPAGCAPSVRVAHAATTAEHRNALTGRLPPL
jgi:hypothetical protein